MENKSQIIINRQTAALQLWLAAKSGGYHFDYVASDNGNVWQDDRSGERFLDTLNRCLSEQSDSKIVLDLE
jgi:CyaY protein